MSAQVCRIIILKVPPLRRIKFYRSSRPCWSFETRHGLPDEIRRKIPSHTAGSSITRSGSNDISISFQYNFETVNFADKGTKNVRYCCRRYGFRFTSTYVCIVAKQSQARCWPVAVVINPTIERQPFFRRKVMFWPKKIKILIQTVHRSYQRSAAFEHTGPVCRR